MIDSLKALLPDERVLAEDAHLAAYESDGLTAFKTKPQAVVRRYGVRFPAGSQHSTICFR